MTSLVEIFVILELGKSTLIMVGLVEDSPHLGIGRGYPYYGVNSTIPGLWDEPEFITSLDIICHITP